MILLCKTVHCNIIVKEKNCVLRWCDFCATQRNLFLKHLRNSVIGFWNGSILIRRINICGSDIFFNYNLCVFIFRKFVNLFKPWQKNSQEKFQMVLKVFYFVFFHIFSFFGHCWRSALKKRYYAGWLNLVERRKNSKVTVKRTFKYIFVFIIQ